jgi:hypothetical protein
MKGRNGNIASPQLNAKSLPPIKLEPSMKKISSHVHLSEASSKDDAGVILRRIGPWREMQGADGDVYYWNKFTGVVTWSHPKQLTHENQNPAVTSVAAALYQMKAKDLREGDEGLGHHEVEDVLADANMMKPMSNTVRKQAELTQRPASDENDQRGYGGVSTDTHRMESNAEVPSVVTNEKDKKDLRRENQNANVTTKTSSIQRW